MRWEEQVRWYWRPCISCLNFVKWFFLSDTDQQKRVVNFIKYDPPPPSELNETKLIVFLTRIINNRKKILRLSQKWKKMSNVNSDIANGRRILHQFRFVDYESNWQSNSVNTCCHGNIIRLNLTDFVACITHYFTEKELWRDPWHKENSLWSIWLSVLRTEDNVVAWFCHIFTDFSIWWQLSIMSRIQLFSQICEILSCSWVDVDS